MKFVALALAALSLAACGTTSPAASSAPLTAGSVILDSRAQQWDRYCRYPMGQPQHVTGPAFIVGPK